MDGCVADGEPLSAWAFAPALPGELQARFSYGGGGLCLAPTLIFGPDVLFAHMLIVAFRQNPHLEARSCAGASGGGGARRGGASGGARG